MTTPFHAKYFAYELSRTGGRSIDRLGNALFDACVDLNPHQIEAAIFALRSPLSKGVLLADEVGLGKTIEAGLVICQHWAERRRKILVITPASIRKQWAIELSEKFNLPTTVLDAKTHREQVKNGNPDPFKNNAVVVCSMHFAGAKADVIKQTPWDLVVIDEAHKLRNSYRQSNRIGQKIKWATEDRRKVLLTATPLQNSLLELYGLSLLIDERFFGDLPSFRTQYVNYGGDLEGLRHRIRSFCWRTLRRQVLEYIRYTERKLITRPFKPTDQEHKLYEAISDFLKKDDNYAIPNNQKHLLILIVRKVLASSPRAVAGTLEIMRDRLKRLLEETQKNAGVVDRLILNETLDDDLLDEILEDEEDFEVEKSDEALEAANTEEPKIDINKLKAEIDEIEGYIRWARGIGVDTKAKALIKALEIGFTKMEEMGAAKKAVIFTESRRTQDYLKEFLEASGYAGKVLLFNGSNDDAGSTSIYNQWVEKNKKTGRVSGSRSIDSRTAIIDHFRDESCIMLATEAASEGINLQFCSLVINFDLPWNPQRIEQRIGRCHRYGQKHDVVVINFLNEKNEADRRVYELLENKFNLFTGLFGASDDVLGSIESGVDFERRVLEIYQQCRSSAEIEAAFAKLQAELDEQIKIKMKDTRKLLLEHFDEDVHERLKVNLLGTRDKLDRIGRLFWAVTKYSLAEFAKFDDEKLAFALSKTPDKKISIGTYYLISKNKDNALGEFLYRLSHPLGEFSINRAKDADCPPSEVSFDVTNHAFKNTVIEGLKGKAGWLNLSHLKIDSFESDEYLLFSAFDDSGGNIDHQTCEKLFNCGASVNQALDKIDGKTAERLRLETERHVNATIARNLEENNRHFSEARDQLDKWAEDMEIAAQKELDDIKRQIRELQRQARQAPTLEEQGGLQEQIAKLEQKKRKMREHIFAIEDEIAEKRDNLIDALEKRMRQRTSTTNLFTIRWKVI
ncbi:MAG: RNA polymerase-associated protein RapA [bacterium ADurb.Bin243]|nr:MAG: RNA polymerase-associated protein RapA [bacterium ADurb.Bin243]